MGVSRSIEHLRKTDLSFIACRYTYLEFFLRIRLQEKVALT